jgi:adenylate cyclase
LAVIGAGSLLLTLAASQSAYFALLNSRIQDATIRYRLRTAPAAEPSTVTLILIDESSRRAIAEPLAYWQPHVATVLRGLAKVNVKAVGVDLMFSAADERARQESRELAQAFAEVSSGGTPVILGYDAASSLPQSPLYLLATTTSPRPLGYVNLPAEADDFVRRVALCKPDPEEPSFSLGAKLAASAAAGEHRCTSTAMVMHNNEVQLDEQRRMVIPFDRAAKPLRVSFADVLALARTNDIQKLQQMFGGRLVLIGSDDPQDRHATPLLGNDAQRTPGVDIHAAIAQSLYTGVIMRDTAGWLPWAAAIFFAATVAWVTLAFRWEASVGLALLLCAATLWPGIIAWNRLWVFSSAHGLVAALSAGVLAFLYRYQVEFRAHRQLHKQFGQYVSPELVRQIVEHGVELGGSRRHITVLFSDIRGFTTMSEKMSPEVVVEQLNEYLDAMTEVIIAEGGYVDKFIGDGILAIFGAPVEQKEASWHAVKAAMKMLERLAALNTKWRGQQRHEFSIGIGIHSGEAVVGNIGSWRKLEYTAVGDTVNTASRVEAMTKNSIQRYNAHILLTGATVDDLERWDHYVDVFSMDIERLKGKTELTQLFVLRGLAGAGRKGGAANA